MEQKKPKYDFEVEYTTPETEGIEVPSNSKYGFEVEYADEATQTRLDSGEITIGQNFDEALAEAEKLQAGGGQPGQLEIAAMSAVDTATFGIPKKLMGDEFEKTVNKVKSENLVANIGGSIAGFFLNPAGMAIRGAKALQGLKGTAGMIAVGSAEILGVEGGASAVEIIDAAMSSNKDLKEITKREVKKTGMSLAGGALFGAGMGALVSAPKYIAKAANNKVTKKAFEAVGKSLNPKAREILEEVPTIVANEGKEGLARKGAALFDDMTALIGKEKEKAVKAGLKEVADLTDQLQGSINKHMDDMVKGIANPEDSIRAIIGLADDFKVAEDSMSAIYGTTLDKISDLAKGKKYNFTGTKDEVLKVFQLEGILDDAGRVVDKTVKSRYPAAHQMLKELGNKKELTISELGQLTRHLGDAATAGVKDNVKSQAAKAHALLRKELTNPDNWGLEAAALMQDLSEQYYPAKQAFNSIRTGIKKTKVNVNRLPSEDVLSVVDDLYSSLGTVDRAGKKFAGYSKFSAAYPEHLQNKVGLALKKSKDLIDYKEAHKALSSTKKIEKIFKHPEKIGAIENDALRNAIINYSKRDEIYNLMGQQAQAIPEIRKALQNPTNKTVTKKALQYVEKYMPKAKPELVKALNSLNKYARVSGASRATNQVNKQIAQLKEFLEPSEYVATQAFNDFVPQAKEAIKALDLVKKIGNRDMSVMKYLPSGFEMATGGAAMALGGGFVDTVTMPYIILRRIAKDPIAFRMMLEKTANKGKLSPKAVQAIIKGAQISTLIGQASQESIEEGM
jgi:tetratricopeptide (TPR) repeat protein